MREYNREIVADRGMEMEAQVLEIIRELQQSSYEPRVSIKEITQRFAEKHSEDYERKITPHWIGRIVRRKLGRLKDQNSPACLSDMGLRSLRGTWGTLGTLRRMIPNLKRRKLYSSHSYSLNVVYASEELAKSPKSPTSIGQQLVGFIHRHKTAVIKNPALRIWSSVDW
jgi:hypothetical protein